LCKERATLPLVFETEGRRRWFGERAREVIGDAARAIL
jgi:hypothetical protein